MSSPSAKRMRLSSPTFDDQVGELSQDDIVAFDSLDAQCPKPVRHLSLEADGDPFRPHTARIHASSMKDSVFEPSEEAETRDNVPPEVDYAAWFNSDSSNLFVGFSAATNAFPGFQRLSTGGEMAKSFIPSAAALHDAKEKMKKWQEEPHLPDQVSTHNESDPYFSTQIVSPPRATFSSARSTYSAQAPEIPTPVFLFRSVNAELTPSKPYSSSQSLTHKPKSRPFKSPLISAASSMPLHRQLSTPNANSRIRVDHSPTNIPSEPVPAVSPLRPSLAANHVPAQKPLGFTPRHGGTMTRPKFVTPFKSVVKYATPRAPTHEIATLPNQRTTVKRVYPPIVSLPRPSKQSSARKIFDLIPPPNRLTLAKFGLRPQAYSAQELQDMGINFKELSQMNLQTAPFYTFTIHSPFPLFDPSSSLALGRLAVLEELHAKGCTLAQQAWIDNHWPLILWKLAGMVTLDPLSESDPWKRRWCWPEVIRQFMYRYERDLNSSSRPPLRLITTRDASAESPMVLCISDIIWPAGGPEDAAPVHTRPDLEVTDGWYRLRARIDDPLARGVRKGKIKIGRKIAVAGAKLSAERREASEILEAYDTSVLLLSGNSTHMAPWHAKLGFQRGPFVATLNSLTADGGSVAVMMLTVTKAYPIAYVEFVENPNGQKQRVGPHDAKEELKLSTRWKTERESHASRLWSEYEKRKYRLLDYAERLEQRAGSRSRYRHDDDIPDKIYDIYDTLQEDMEAAKTVVSSMSDEDASWLAQHIRERVVQGREVVSKDIEQELESTCPPRDVKAFCVVVVNDAKTYKYPTRRSAQVTVWDVPRLPESEDTQSPFVPGQRYLVTNLVPTQAPAWMDRSSSGEVFLSTRKNSKWTLVK